MNRYHLLGIALIISAFIPPLFVPPTYAEGCFSPPVMDSLIPLFASCGLLIIGLLFLIREAAK